LQQNIRSVTQELDTQKQSMSNVSTQLEEVVSKFRIELEMQNQNSKQLDLGNTMNPFENLTSLEQILNSQGEILESQKDRI